MKKRERMGAIKKAVLTGMFAFLTTAMLLESETALELSASALNLWFQKMIPALLPFMILSGILIRMNLSDRFAKLFAPLLRPVFRLSDSCLYVIVIGFLCGFPMGARVTAESYERGKLDRREAALLLAFCNNIGPIYFTGFVLTLFPVSNPWPYLAGMYLLPLLYGLVLRYMAFRDISVQRGEAQGKISSAILSEGSFSRKQVPLKQNKKKKEGRTLHAAQAADGPEGRTDTWQKEAACGKPGKAPSLLEQMQEAITSSLTAIASLGGYMILFNLMNLFPILLLPGSFRLLRALCGCLLEITSGLAQLPASQAFWAFVLLPFGGFSCIAQTYSMLRETDLPLGAYVCHKCAQTGLAFLYYAGIHYAGIRIL